MTDQVTRSRVAVVTGGVRGIGLEIVRQFLADGFKVAVLDINDDGFGEAAHTLKAEAAFVSFLACDITKPDQLMEAEKKISTSLGVVDILVNCAGWTPNRLFVELTGEDADKIIAINFRAVLDVTRFFLPKMIENGWGRIINISSDAARVGTPRESVYSGAKAGVIGFSKSLCAEVARFGITVNVVCPGTTDTPLMHEALTAEQIARRVAANPSKRIALPSDVAGVVSFFASDVSAFINGQVISVNGGITRIG